MANIAAIIADAQITNGGPIILYQPENEYTIGLTIPFPNGEYFQYVEDQARNSGIVVPFISNDAIPLGHNAPGSGKGEVDIYGHDGYPLGFDCVSRDSLIQTQTDRPREIRPHGQFSICRCTIIQPISCRAQALHFLSSRSVKISMMTWAIILTKKSFKEEVMIHGLALDTTAVQRC